MTFGGENRVGITAARASLSSLELGRLIRNRHKVGSRLFGEYQRIHLFYPTDRETSPPESVSNECAVLRRKPFKKSQSIAGTVPRNIYCIQPGCNYNDFETRCLCVRKIRWQLKVKDPSRHIAKVSFWRTRVFEGIMADPPFPIAMWELHNNPPWLTFPHRFIGVSDIASVRFSLPAQLLEPTPNLGMKTAVLYRPGQGSLVPTSNDAIFRILELFGSTRNFCSVCCRSLASSTCWQSCAASVTRTMVLAECSKCFASGLQKI